MLVSCCSLYSTRDVWSWHEMRYSEDIGSIRWIVGVERRKSHCSRSLEWMTVKTSQSQIMKASQHLTGRMSYIDSLRGQRDLKISWRWLIQLLTVKSSNFRVTVTVTSRGLILMPMLWSHSSSLKPWNNSSNIRHPCYIMPWQAIQLKILGGTLRPHWSAFTCCSAL